MYSRKYIRSPVGISPAERNTSISGGITLPSAMRTEERSLSLPPDYTGMAFSLQNREDYPETQIPPLHEEIAAEQEDSTPLPVEEERTEPHLSKQPSPIEPEKSPPAEEEVAPLEEEAPAPSSVEADRPAKEEAGPIEPPTPALPLLTSELLRSLTLEDLLLFWMLLMLTTSSQEDQIYLLLGLLLFHR